MKNLIFSMLLVIMSMAARSQQGLTKGDKAPDFAGRDQYKKAVKLSEVLKKGKAVLIF